MTRATEDTVIKLPPRLGIGNRERTEAIVDEDVSENLGAT